jgi:hypothetical protein
MPEDKNKKKKAAESSLAGAKLRQFTIGPDTRTADEKEVGQALFFQRKKMEEAAGADFTTPDFIKNQVEKRKENLMRTATVGVVGAALLTAPGAIRAALGRSGSAVSQGIRGIELAPKKTIADKIIGLAQVIDPSIPAMQNIAAKFLLNNVPENLQTDKFKEIVGKFVIKEGESKMPDMAAKRIADKASYGQYRKMTPNK